MVDFATTDADILLCSESVFDCIGAIYVYTIFAFLFMVMSSVYKTDSANYL